MSMLRSLWVGLALTSLVACGSSGSSKIDAAGGGPDGAGGPDAAPTSDGGVVGNKITLTLEGLPVAPGSERQYCKIVNLPAGADVDVVEMHSTMSGTSHHFNVYKVLGNTSPVAAADAVSHDCAPASEQLNGMAAYIFGSATPERTFDTPAGVSFHLLPQQQIILEQHVINATDTEVTGSATFDLILAPDPATIQHHADIIWLGDWKFCPGFTKCIMPGVAKSDTASCTVPYDVQIFGLMSHTHRYGVGFTIDTCTGSSCNGGNTTARYDNVALGGTWDHPKYQEESPLIDVAANNSIQWTCNWMNTGTVAVGPGQNSTDEMCIAFAAAYPKNSLDANPIQCNVAF